MRRRLLALALAVTLALGVAPAPALGAKTKAQKLGAQLEKLSSEARRAGRAYDKAFWRLDETEVRLGRVEKRMDRTSAELAAAQALLAKRANAMYRADEVDFLAVLLGATSFQELVTRLEYLQKVGAQDAATIARVKGLAGRLERERARLGRERTARARSARELRKRRDVLQRDLRAKNAEYARVNAALRAELDRERQAGRSLSYRTPRGPDGMVFPVAGACYYSDTWGASRSGGRRSHKGTDIMAARGTPCVAVLSGTAVIRDNGLGGKCIWLTADNGWRFYYAHLDRYGKTGRVRAGQVIGYVGSTGNAAESAPHLHFQIHPNGGAAVNPYPYLRRMR